MGTNAASKRSSRDNDDVQRFFATLLADLPVPPAGTQHALPAHCVRLKFKTIRGECGFRRMRESSFEELATALKHARIHSRPLLTPGLGSGEWVRFSRCKFPEDSILFTREDALKALLVE